MPVISDRSIGVPATSSSARAGVEARLLLETAASFAIALSCKAAICASVYPNAFACSTDIGELAERAASARTSLVSCSAAAACPCAVVELCCWPPANSPGDSPVSLSLLRLSMVAAFAAASAAAALASARASLVSFSAAACCACAVPDPGTVLISVPAAASP